LAFKGNSTNILARNIVCRTANGMAIGSVGQYIQYVSIIRDGAAISRNDSYYHQQDIVENVLMEDVQLIRQNKSVNPTGNQGVR
jgi:galacturan 1,4-alpha-galacturonidase